MRGEFEELQAEGIDVRLNQAERIVRKFGGPTRLRELLRAAGLPVSFMSIWRWRSPKARGGTGGRIPSRVWPYLVKASKLDGVLLTMNELDPRAFIVQFGKNDMVFRAEFRRYLRRRHDVRNRPKRKKPSAKLKSPLNVEKWGQRKHKGTLQG